MTTGILLAFSMLLPSARVGRSVLCSSSSSRSWLLPAILNVQRSTHFRESAHSTGATISGTGMSMLSTSASGAGAVQPSLFIGNTFKDARYLMHIARFFTVVIGGV